METKFIVVVDLVTKQRAYLGADKIEADRTYAALTHGYIAAMVGVREGQRIVSQRTVASAHK